MIFHIDRGSEYTSRKFARACRNLDVFQSMGRAGSCFRQRRERGVQQPDRLRTRVLGRPQRGTGCIGRTPQFEGIETAHDPALAPLPACADSPPPGERPRPRYSVNAWPVAAGSFAQRPPAIRTASGRDGCHDCRQVTANSPFLAYALNKFFGPTSSRRAAQEDRLSSTPHYVWALVRITTNGYSETSPCRA